MTGERGVDLVTGAFSYSGGHIAELLLESGRAVRTLTFHPDRAHPLQGQIDARRYAFGDRSALARSLDGVANVYNTYWVRFDHQRASFERAVENSRALFDAARRAGAARVIHVSIANPALDSGLRYYRGKALVEQALAGSGIPYSIVRPTLVFGGDRDVLVNNIAWILRHTPLFPIPGDGRYPVQPVHVADLARICVDSSRAEGNTITDAAGPETLTFDELVRAIRSATGSRAPIIHVPPTAMALASRALGLLVRDVVLTPDEIKGLMAGLLASDSPPAGTIGFTEWLNARERSLGAAYANELSRHFALA